MSMADVRKTSGPDSAQGVIYDLARARQRASEPQPPAPTDSAGITESARELGRARAAVEAAPDTRQQHVRALRQQIANGRYQPDPKEIAREILDRGF